MACKDLAGKVLSKCMVKMGSSRFWGGLMVFWLLPEQSSALNKGKFIENGQTGLRNLLFEAVAA